VLVILSNTPHALDPMASYAPKSLLLTIEQGPLTVAREDVCRTSCEQNQRGFALTEDYNLGS
jgi:hypothetical protein